MQISLYQILCSIDALCGPQQYDPSYNELAVGALNPPMPEHLHAARYTSSQASNLITFGFDYINNIGSGINTPYVEFLTNESLYIEVWADWSAMPQTVSLAACLANYFPSQPIVGA